MQSTVRATRVFVIHSLSKGLSSTSNAETNQLIYVLFLNIHRAYPKTHFRRLGGCEAPGRGGTAESRSHAEYRRGQSTATHARGPSRQ